MEIPEDAVLLRISLARGKNGMASPSMKRLSSTRGKCTWAVPRSCAGRWVTERPAGCITTKILNLTFDLPLIVEIVDSEAKINAFHPVIDQMIGSGLVTLEKATVLYYRGRKD